MSFEFKSDDTFLINRDNKSYTITALETKNIVNPEGVLIPPDIEGIINGQGFPVQSDEIDRIYTTADGLKFTMKSDLDLNLIPSFPDPIEMSEPYVPITTGVESVSTSGDEYTLKFLPVNYDFSFFNLNDNVFIDTDSTIKGEITGIDTTKGTITITSNHGAWATVIGMRIVLDTDLNDPLTATGTLESFGDENGKVTCVVNNIVGRWVDQYNNRRKKIRFDTTLPRGGFEIDANGFTFRSSPFDMRDKGDPSIPNSVLTLQKVLWRINGKEYVGTITEGDAPQTFNAPAGSMYESGDLTNSITVTYQSANYRETSERYFFRSDLNPKTSTTTVDVFNRVTGFQTDLTTMGL